MKYNDVHESEDDTMIKGLPERLKTLRMRYAYSQKQVAGILKVSPSIVSGYETGERTPSVDILLSLSYLYNCSVDYLLGKELSDSVPTVTVDGLSERQIQAIRNLIDSMKNTEQ